MYIKSLLRGNCSRLVLASLHRSRKTRGFCNFDCLMELAIYLSICRCTIIRCCAFMLILYIQRMNLICEVVKELYFYGGYRRLEFKAL